VGLQGALAGTRLIQVLGSVFDDAMPLGRFGIADAAVPLAGLAPALEQWVRTPRRAASERSPATPRVLAVLREFL
jgi:DNA-binding transcriptional regulator YdaS (Cro superfamily)